MNIVEKCSREIERVTVLRAAYALTDRMAGRQALAGAVAFMTKAIESGHTALGTGDPVTIIAAIRELEGFRE
jgi:hypothetical protein